MPKLKLFQLKTKSVAHFYHKFSWSFSKYAALEQVDCNNH